MRLKKGILLNVDEEELRKLRKTRFKRNTVKKVKVTSGKGKKGGKKKV